MKPIPATAQMLGVVPRIIWFEPPERALADPIRFMAYAMTYVAPMMDWTDRHCRYLHRPVRAPHALLYTEMIVSAAIVRGNAQRLLEFDAA
jgi:hypothetical protein